MPPLHQNTHRTKEGGSVQHTTEVFPVQVQISTERDQSILMNSLEGFNSDTSHSHIKAISPLAVAAVSLAPHPTQSQHGDSEVVIVTQVI